MAPEPTTAPSFDLPHSIVSPSDVSKLRHELEKLEDFLTQERLRHAEHPAELPRNSDRLNDLAQRAEVDITKVENCQQLRQKLEIVTKGAPQIHISFATDPSDAFIAQIIDWFRKNIHPQLLLNVGLQPSIAAGFVMRTSSHYFDCSLRKHFTDKKQMLVDAIEASGK